MSTMPPVSLGRAYTHMAEAEAVKRNSELKTRYPHWWIRTPTTQQSNFDPMLQLASAVSRPQPTADLAPTRLRDQG